MWGSHLTVISLKTQKKRKNLSDGWDFRFFHLIGNCVAFPIKQKALRVDRTAAEQDSIFTI